MEKNRRIGSAIFASICLFLFFGASLTYFMLTKHDCGPEFVYLSYTNPDNSTTHFKVEILNVGGADGNIGNVQSFSFKNENEILYPYRAYTNITQITFPLTIEQGEKVNITLELNWHFEIDAEYTFTLTYDNGKSFDIVFLFPGGE